MSVKGINHFVFFPDKRSSWREKFVKRTENEVTNLRKTCADKKINLSCGVVLDATIKLMSAADLNLLVAKLSFLVKVGVIHFSIFMNQVMSGGDDQSGADFAAEQAKFLNVVAAEVQTFSNGLDESKLHWYVLPTHFYANFSDSTPIPRNQIDYWKSFNKTLNSQIHIYFQIHNIAKYASKLSLFFPNRRIIALEQFPAPNFPVSSDPRFIPLEPYEPHSDGGDLEKLPSLLLGMAASSRSMQFATTTSEWALVSLLTFLDFVRNPTNYRKMISHKAALTAVLKDERLVSDMLDIVAMAPSSILLEEAQITTTDTSRHAKLVSQDLQAKLTRVRTGMGEELASGLSTYLDKTMEFLSKLSE